MNRPNRNMVKRTCYFTAKEWSDLRAAAEIAELSASQVLRGLVKVYLALDPRSVRQKLEEPDVDEDRLGRGLEPPEEPPWCDRCGLYHSDEMGCEV
jgi:hypothetical protein